MMKKEGNDVDERDGKSAESEKEEVKEVVEEEVEEVEEEEEDQDEGVEEDQEPLTNTEEEEVARSRMRRVKDRLRLGLFLSEKQLKLIDDVLYLNVQRGKSCVVSVVVCVV